MLVVSATSREDNRQSLADQFRRARVFAGLRIRQSHFEFDSCSWYEYWLPARDFFAADTRLVHRLNRLKRAWLDLLKHPTQRHVQAYYCWRYFGLLHHTLRIARSEPWRGNPLPALRRILGFECFPLNVTGAPGTASCILSGRNPLYLLGQLPSSAPAPTPRHVALSLPIGTDEWCYHYRQFILDAATGSSVLLSPCIDLCQRPTSFSPIDRFARLVTERADPYWRPRARLLTKRVLMPLFRGWQQERPACGSEHPLSILDLGAGTGHLVGKAWRYLGRSAAGLNATASFHFVDSADPSLGRSFGISRTTDNVAHVEWTTGDYRALVDDDQWLRHHGPFDWVFICRLFDNASNFSLEPVESDLWDQSALDCLPHRCLAPHQQPGGTLKLRISTSRRSVNGGIAMPQFSLNDYFAALMAVKHGSLEAVKDRTWYLPVRRFNPAALTTRSGRSLIGQLIPVSKAIIIEDLDLEPEHLKQHREQFGLTGTAAVHCVRDGFNTEARHYVIASPEWAQHLRGERLW